MLKTRYSIRYRYQKFHSDTKSISVRYINTRIALRKHVQIRALIRYKLSKTNPILFLYSILVLRYCTRYLYSILFLYSIPDTDSIDNCRHSSYSHKTKHTLVDQHTSIISVLSARDENSKVTF